MSTYLNPTHVSGSQNVSENGFVSPKGQPTAVDQLEHKAANWEASEIVEPPPYGEPSSSDVLKVDSKRHTWPVYLVSVPEGWEPSSCRTVPPNTQRYKSALAAAEVARVLNQDRIDRSKDGRVYNWHIRTKFNSKYAIISINVPHPWKPKSPYDMPPPFIFIDGPAEECKRVIGELNDALFKEDSSKRKRAYIGRSIHPEEIKQVEQPKEEQTEAQLVEPEEDETELFEIQMGHHFGTNPTISEDVMLHVQNASNSEDARRKADSFLMEHAIDMNQRVALNGFSEADDDGNEYSVVLSNGKPLRFRLSRSEALNLVSVWNQSRKHSEPEARAVKR